MNQHWSSFFLLSRDGANLNQGMAHPLFIERPNTVEEKVTFFPFIFLESRLPSPPLRRKGTPGKVFGGESRGEKSNSDKEETAIPFREVIKELVA